MPLSNKSLNIFESVINIDISAEKLSNETSACANEDWHHDFTAAGPALLLNIAGGSSALSRSHEFQ